jgi:hypothetical protein
MEPPGKDSDAWYCSQVPPSTLADHTVADRRCDDEIIGISSARVVVSMGDIADQIRRLFQIPQDVRVFG